jgi:hypothetical protein
LVVLDFTVSVPVPFTLSGTFGPPPTGPGSGSQGGYSGLRHADPGNRSAVAFIIPNGQSQTFSGELQPGKYEFAASLYVSAQAAGWVSSASF